MLRMLAGAIAFLAMVVPSFWALRSSMIPSASITTNTVDCFRGTIALRATAWLARREAQLVFEYIAKKFPNYAIGARERVLTATVRGYTSVEMALR